MSGKKSFNIKFVMTEAIFSITWFGPVLYYALLNRAEIKHIEGSENFRKQTYRNRCELASTNGPLILTIPVEGNNKNKTNIKDIKLSDHGDWQRMHWNSIESAYNSSPFFEFYSDDIRPFFEKKERWLFDYDEEIRIRMFDLLNIKGEVKITDTYTNDFKVNEPIILDFRDTIQPKSTSLKDIEEDLIKPYYQVFERKFGFLPNLSVLDLLFNMGPEAILFL